MGDGFAASQVWPMCQRNKLPFPCMACKSSDAIHSNIQNKREGFSEFVRSGSPPMWQCAPAQPLCKPRNCQIHLLGPTEGRECAYRSVGKACGKSLAACAMPSPRDTHLRSQSGVTLTTSRSEYPANSL
eukprot:3441596-Amphidinium_carterae.2